jgi:hypothetical protein
MSRGGVRILGADLVVHTSCEKGRQTQWSRTAICDFHLLRREANTDKTLGRPDYRHSSRNLPRICSPSARLLIRATTEVAACLKWSPLGWSAHTDICIGTLAVDCGCWPPSSGLPCCLSRSLCAAQRPASAWHDLVVTIRSRQISCCCCQLSPWCHAVLRLCVTGMGGSLLRVLGACCLSSHPGTSDSYTLVVPHLHPRLCLRFRTYELLHRSCLLSLCLECPG